VLSSILPGFLQILFLYTYVIIYVQVCGGAIQYTQSKILIQIYFSVYAMENPIPSYCTTQILKNEYQTFLNNFILDIDGFGGETSEAPIHL